MYFSNIRKRKSIFKRLCKKNKQRIEKMYIWYIYKYINIYNYIIFYLKKFRKNNQIEDYLQKKVFQSIKKKMKMLISSLMNKIHLG